MPVHTNDKTDRRSESGTTSGLVYLVKPDFFDVCGCNSTLEQWTKRGVICGRCGKLKQPNVKDEKEEEL